jgi:ribosome-associated protein
MAYDEEHDDGLGGRSRSRREVTESWRWGARLVLLPKWHVDAMVMPDKLRAAIAVCRNISSPIARKRQIGHVDSLLRDLEEDVREGIERLLESPPEGRDPDSVVKGWVERLKAGGDDVIDAFVEAFPACDRQRLRQCVRGGKVNTIERYVRECVPA